MIQQLIPKPVAEMETIMQNIPTCQTMMKRVYIYNIFPDEPESNNNCVKYEQLTILGKDFTHLLCGIMGKSLDPTLNIH